MADATGNDSSEFSFGYFENVNEDIEVPDVGSDISVSPVSTPDLSPVDSSSESDSDDEDLAWRPVLRKPVNKPFTEPVGATFTLEKESNELDFFLKFFDEGLFAKIVEETNNYAENCIQRKPDQKWKEVSVQELKAFFGIYIYISVVQIPTYTLAWSQMWPFGSTSIPEIMTRTRFEQISKYLHCNNVSQNPPRRTAGHDKLCHVRPILESIQQKCLENYNPFREQSIDEGMIAYKGRLSFKQYLPAKPTKFGIKVWERASPQNGFCHEFQIYTGKVEGGATEEGLGARVVKDLTRKITKKGHHIYMDNFFSSPKLFTDLYSEDVYCCGTVRGNRKGMPEAIKGCKLKNHGDYKIMQKNELCATAWKDKKTVFYLSTNADPTEMISVQRKQKDGSVKDVPCPVVGQQYNRYMFGVDRADQLQMQYSTCRKSKKWWKYLLWFPVDLAVVNAYICMKESTNHKIKTRSGREITRTQLNFRMQLSRQLIGTFRGSRKRKARSNVDSEGVAHWPVKHTKRGKCKQCTAEKRRHEVNVQCKQCKVFLCIEMDALRNSM